MPTIVHFDIATEDPARGRKFYTELFGWNFQSFPEMQYDLITNTNLDGTPGVGGGLGKRMDPSERITNYFGVKSIEAAMKKVEKLGGKLVSPKMPVPGMGYLVNCVDTEGNIFGLWEEDAKVK